MVHKIHPRGINQSPVPAILCYHHSLQVAGMAGKDSEGKSDISTNMTATEKKKKRPPEYLYLPRDRARKLKKEWVEKKKIKAQWKHEKRKGNIEWPKKPQDAEEVEEAAVAGITSDTLRQASSDIDKESFPPRARRAMGHGLTAPERSSKPEQVTTKTPMLPPPQINRTSKHPMRDADKKRQSADKSKKEHWTGKRRPTTVREKMGLLLEKIQKNLDSST